VTTMSAAERQRRYRAKDPDGNRTRNTELKRKWRREHPDAEREASRRWREKHPDHEQVRTQALRDLMGQLVCVDCGAPAHDWHHRIPETRTFWVSRLRSPDHPAFLPEVEKCDVLCRSCHMRRHRESV